MKNAVLQSLKYSALQQPLQDFLAQFAADASSDDVLTQTEITDLNNVYNGIIDNANKQFEQLQNITQLDFSPDGSSSSANTLQGAVKNITEQSAELLAGQFGAFRITNQKILENATAQLNQLNAIAANTAYIISLDNRWRDIQTNGLKIK